MKTLFLLVLLFVGLIATTEGYTTRWHINAANITRLVIFGDDYSDIGNVYTLSSGTFPNPANYDGYAGPVCNGPLWWEQLNEQYLTSGLDLSSPLEAANFAFIGAGLDSATRPYASHIPGTSIPVPGLLQQVGLYFNSYNATPDGTLFVIFAGTNELLGNPPTAFPALLDTLTSNIMTAVTNLLTHPTTFGKPLNVLTVSLLPIGSSPYINQVYGNATAKSLNDLIGAFNGILRQKILGFKRANPTVFAQSQWVDLTAEFARMAGKPAQFGFNLNGGPLQMGTCAASTDATDFCKVKEWYYWWNPVWISSQAHHWIAQRIFNEAFIQGEQYFYNYF